MNTNHGRIAALTFGDPALPPVLALHGWLDNAASFECLAPLLEKHHIVALDFPGHGHSDHRPAAAGYAFIDYVPVVLECADALEWTRFSLLGHSMGAGVAMILAAAVPERIQRLVMIDGIGPYSGKAEKAPGQLTRALTHPRRTRTGSGTRYADLETLIDARLSAGTMKRDSARRLVTRNTDHSQQGYRWRTDRRLMAPSLVYLTEPQVQAYIAAVSVPVLLVLADNGIMADYPHRDKRIGAFQNIQVAELRGDHHLHLDDPQAVAVVVNPFLAGA